MTPTKMRSFFDLPLLDAFRTMDWVGVVRYPEVILPQMRQLLAFNNL